MQREPCVLRSLRDLSQAHDAVSMNLSCLFPRMPPLARQMFLASGLPESLLEVHFDMLVPFGPTDSDYSRRQSVIFSRSGVAADDLGQFRHVSVVLHMHRDSPLCPQAHESLETVPCLTSPRCNICKAVMPADRSHECSFVACCRVMYAGLQKWQKVNSLAASKMQLVSDDALARFCADALLVDGSMSQESAEHLMQGEITARNVIKSCTGDFYTPCAESFCCLARVDYDLFCPHITQDRVAPAARITFAGIKACAATLYTFISMIQKLFPRANEVNLSPLFLKTRAGGLTLSPLCAHRVVKEIFNTLIVGGLLDVSFELQPTFIFLQMVFKELLFMDGHFNFFPMECPGQSFGGCGDYIHLIDSLRKGEICDAFSLTRARDMYVGCNLAFSACSFFSCISQRCQSATLEALATCVASFSSAGCLSSSQRPSSDDQASIRSFLHFIKTIFCTFDTEYQKERNRALVLNSVDVKMLQAIDLILWKIGSLSRTTQGNKKLATINVQSMTRDEKCRMEWTEERSLLKQICKVSAPREADVEQSGARGECDYDALSKRRHELRLERERLEARLFSMKKPRIQPP